MILYHGSQQIIEYPEFGKGKKDNDYGSGFYMTRSLDLAKEWACPFAHDGYANSYSLDSEDLCVLYLNGPEFNILNWLALLLNNRDISLSRNRQAGLAGRKYIIENFLPDISSADVIVGYRADDRYFAFARDFVSNTISLGQLSEAMKLGELGEQYVLVSEKAFSRIHFLGYEISDSGIYYPKRIEREKIAGQAYNDMLGKRISFPGDLYIIDILREGIKNDDPRIG